MMTSPVFSIIETSYVPTFLNSFLHMVNLDFQGIYHYHIYFYAVEPLKTNLSDSMAPGWLFGICIMGYDNCYSHNNFFLINMP